MDVRKGENMINTVVFDIGNVLVDFRWKELYEELGFTGEKFEKIADATVRSPWWNEFDRGLMELEEIIAKFSEKAPEYEAEIRSIFDHMDNLLRGRDYANAWIRDLQEKGYKVYILSNMSKPADEVHGKGCMNFLEFVDGAILSYKEGMVKPERCIYELLCDRFQIVPETAVFLDDTLRNIEAAKAFGLHGIHFQTYEQAKAELDAMLS